MEPKVLKALRATKAKRVSMEPRVPKVLQDLKAHKATRAKRVLTEPRVLKVLQDLKAPKEPKAIKAKKVK